MSFVLTRLSRSRAWTGVLFFLPKCLWGAAAIGFAAHGGTLPNSISIHDRGQHRHFEVSQDEPALYEKGVPRSKFTRRVFTRKIAVKLADGIDIARVAQLTKATAFRHIDQLQGWAIFEAKNATAALDIMDALRKVPGIHRAEVQLGKQHQAKLIPNDSFFPQQWHLANTGQNGGLPGLDIQVSSVWDHWRGAGMVIGVVDCGIQSAHPDLAPNLKPALGLNVTGVAYSPKRDYHGTAVAGLAAAQGNNGVGITGVAFEAGLADIRFLGGYTTDEQDAEAMLHGGDSIQVMNNSWGADDGTGSLEGPGPLMAAAFAEATTTGRHGKGTIFVFAAGNGLASGENVNYDGYANSRFVIAVGAVGDLGQQASYSEPGACLAVCAPSGSGPNLCSGGHQQLTTTDTLGNDGYNFAGASCELSTPDYTRNFAGTSGAAPIVSGVVALMLEANPNLGWRDVKEILLRSARKVTISDPDWNTNSSGIAHNHRFGAGLISAQNAVTLATNWMNLGAASAVSLTQTNLNLNVSDNDPAGLTFHFTVTNAGFRVETAALTITLPHPRYGDLAITLTSPDGTTSRLAEPHTAYDTGYNPWTFTSVRHWGESAQGQWTVKIADMKPGFTGTLQNLQLDLFGSTPKARLDLTRSNDSYLIMLSAPAPGWRYALESSPDLTDWTAVTTLTISNNGTALPTELQQQVAPTFYRARLAQ